MANVVVVGAQWGDEGKGKIVDWLSERADVVVRYQVGHNAGHPLVIDGVSYEVDITQPARYGKDGTKVSDGQRISNLTFNGQPVDPAQKFYVVTNNYRASGGGHFPGIDGSNIVHEDPSETREIIAQYLKAQSADNPSGFSPAANNNWHMKALPANVDVRLYSSPTDEAKALAGADLAYQSTLPMDDAKHPGYAIYRLIRQ